MSKATKPISITELANMPLFSKEPEI